MILYQGNTYRIPLRLTVKGTPITDTKVKKVEFAIGEVIKTYPDQITYENDKFFVFLSQEDTFSLEGQENCQIRVMFIDGTVKCADVETAIIKRSVSKEVLK